MAQSNEEIFQRALIRFKRSLTLDLANEFSICSLADVDQVCKEIEKKHGCDGKLRHMRRLRGFMEAIEQFGKVIEVFVNASEVVCFIWGPMKFVLLATFEKHPTLATVLEDYYSDILEFHRMALAIFKRPRWKDMYHSVWKTFDSSISPVLHSLCKRRELLESEKSSAALYEIQRLRKDLSVMYTEHQQHVDEERLQKHKARVSQIRERLHAPNYEIDQEMAAGNILIDSSGKWIFESNEFQTWYTNTFGHGILYLNGIPGAGMFYVDFIPLWCSSTNKVPGKTTLVSAVIKKLLDERNSVTLNHCVVYFYFKHKEPTKQSHNSLLRGILDQLVSQDSAMSDHLFNRISSMDPTSLRLTRTLEGFIKEAFGSYQTAYIVLDGLDESAPKEAETSVELFLSLVKGFENSTTSLRVLFCGQRDGVLDHLLVDEPSITLENTAHNDDIKGYCSHVCERIGKKFGLSHQFQEDISRQVANGAKGMFLYARVVLDNLLSQTRLSSLRHEMQPGTFPEGIKKAYERVAVRVFKESSPSECEDARTILGWITCAGRLLRWREIQSSFCIIPNEGVVEYEEGKLRVTCKELCRSLVDVHSESGNGNEPDDIIKIVHDTAREYLTRNGWIDINLAHAKLAIFCSRYLTSRPFDCGIDNQAVNTNAIRGYYALQDYSVAFWFYHTMECIKLTGKLDIATRQEVITSVLDFLNSYSTLDTRSISNSEIERVIEALNELPKDDKERNTYLNIESRTIRIRKVLETIQNETLDHKTQEMLMNLHGTTKMYKCSKPWCEFFTTGYGRMEDRRLHLNRHDLPFCCTFEECPARSVGFDTQSKLNQHVKRYHRESTSDELEFPKTRPLSAGALYKAITRGDIAVVRRGLRSRVNIDNRPAWGYERGGPLYVAAEHGQTEICNLLLRNGALGQTPLHAAVLGDRINMVGLFLSQEQCIPDVTDDTGLAPFLHACRKGNLGIVKMLFETGKIDVNQLPLYSNRNGATALWHAIKEGHFRVVQYIINETPAGPVSRYDLTAAVVRSHKSIANILLPAITSSSQNNTPDNPYETGFPLSCVRLDRDWFVIYNQHAPHRFPNINSINTVDIPKNRSQILFSSCGKYVVSFYQDSVFEIYDVRSMVQVGRFQTDFFPVDYVFLGSAGKWLVVVNCNYRTYGITLAMDYEVTTVAFSSSGNLVVAGSGNGAVKVWDTSTGNLLQCINAPQSRLVHIKRAWFLPNDENIIVCRTAEHVQLYELSGHNKGLYSSSIEKSVKGIWEDHVQGCPLTFDSNWVLSAYQGGGVEFLDTQNNTSRLLLQLSEDDDIYIAVSPTQALFATCNKGKLRIWSYN
ncbi:hypothetical protein F4774DRAFT_420091 [Daldinia eschscholtzii]|nr:hypothetical protein F4774DRAFT_420091 [Daldinia eschscholtzii]